MKREGFLKRRWLEFRMGHGTYLSFFISFTQFVLIAYEFAFKEYIDSVLVFGIIFCATYMPVATLIGHWHNIHQQDTDIKIRMKYVVDEMKAMEKRLEAKL